MMDCTECQSSDICVYTCDGHGKWSVEFKPHTVNTYRKTQTSSKNLSSSQTGTAKQKSSGVKVKICLVKHIVFA